MIALSFSFLIREPVPDIRFSRKSFLPIASRTRARVRRGTATVVRSTVVVVRFQTVTASTGGTRAARWKPVLHTEHGRARGALNSRPTAAWKGTPMPVEDVRDRPGLASRRRRRRAPDQSCFAAVPSRHRPRPY